MESLWTHLEKKLFMIIMFRKQETHYKRIFAWQKKSVSLEFFLETHFYGALWILFWWEIFSVHTFFSPDHLAVLGDFALLENCKIRWSF